jgi:O-antigen ligase
MNTDLKELTNETTRLEAYIFYALAVFVAGFYLLPPGKFHNNIYYAFVLLPGLALLWRERQRIQIGASLFTLLAYLGYTALSSLWSTPDRQEPGSAFKYAFYIFMLFALLALVINKTDKLRAKFFRITYLAASVAAIANIILWYSDRPITYQLYGSIGINECIGLGVSYGFAALLAYNDLATSQKRNEIARSSLALIILFSAIILTQSRLALGCTIGSILILSLFQLNKRVMVIATAVALAITLTFIIEPSLLSRHTKLIDQILDNQNFSRYHIWMSLLDKMDGNWLFGHGLNTQLNNYVANLGNYKYVTAHNVYIGQIFLSGLVGVALLLILGFNCLLSSFKLLDNHKTSVGIAATTFAALCMSGQYTYLLDHPNETWINILIPLAVALSFSLVKPTKPSTLPVEA